MRLLPFRGSAALRDASLTKSQLRGSAWVRLLPDVYISAAVEMDHRLWAYAACLYAGEGAVVSGATAAYLWGVDLVTGAPSRNYAGPSRNNADVAGANGVPVEVTIPPTRRVRTRMPHVTVVRAALAPTDVTTFGLLTLTTPERTAADLVRRLDRVEGIVALDAMLHRRVVTMEKLLARAVDMSGRYGGAVFADAVRLADAGAESPMETRLRMLFVDGGLPRPVAQFAICDRRGRFVGRGDLAYPEHLVCIEYEGDHHRERATFRRDIARVNAMQEAGWVVIRVTADDIYLTPEQLIQRVRRLIS